MIRSFATEIIWIATIEEETQLWVKRVLGIVKMNGLILIPAILCVGPMSQSTIQGINFTDKDRQYRNHGFSRSGHWLNYILLRVNVKSDISVLDHSIKVCIFLYLTVSWDLSVSPHTIQFLCLSALHETIYKNGGGFLAWRVLCQFKKHFMGP